MTSNNPSPEPVDDPDVWGECDGCGGPIRHDELVLELTFGLNCHGDLVGRPEQDNAVIHQKRSCLTEVIQRG